MRMMAHPLLQLQECGFCRLGHNMSRYRGLVVVCQLLHDFIPIEMGQAIGEPSGKEVSHEDIKFE